MISSYFITLSIWFTIIFLIFLIRDLKSSDDHGFFRIFSYSLIVSLFLSLPTFYGMYKLLIYNNIIGN